MAATGKDYCVIEEYLDNPDYRAMFGFPAELEEMILRRPAYRTLLPVCRLDIFLNEETGDFRFCEFNADGSSAMKPTTRTDNHSAKRRKRGRGASSSDDGTAACRNVDAADAT